MNSTEVYNRFISRTRPAAAADVLWSSAMDLQVKLVNDGPMALRSRPRAPKLPAWAEWKDKAYGTTFEPVAIVYNKRLLSGDEVPQTTPTSRCFTTKADKYKGKVTTYDIEKSGVGFMFMTQDARVNPQFVGPRQGHRRRRRCACSRSTGTMLERIFVGREPDRLQHARLVCAGARQEGPVDRLRLPKDYTLVVSRVDVHQRRRRRTRTPPSCGSTTCCRKRGQTMIANEAELFSIRSDVKGETTSPT